MTGAEAVNSRSTSLTIVAAVAAGVALYFAQEIFIPIALGLMFTSLFRPVVRGLARIQIPAPVGATAVTLGFLGLFAAGGYFAVGPIQGWVRDTPKTLAAARGKIDKLRQPIKQVSQAVEKAQKEVTGGEQQQGKPDQSAAPSSGSGVPPVLGRVFATTAGILSTLLQTLVIMFLVLATGDLMARKLAVVLPKQASGTPEQTVDEAESVVRRYMVVTLLLSGGQAIIIALVFSVIGMPSPVLWGILTFLLECLPYLGALIMVAAITITAFATLEGVGQILLPPLAYITVSTIQNNVVSPFAYGSGLRLNPLAVLLVVVVGWFLWGVAGAFVAVPVLAAIRIFAERASPNSRLAAVLGD
jgi:predicted PurR-regulated permease PerM